jgi:succinate dehydrogenase / fumarate reductase cytochrome b subunit
MKQNRPVFMDLRQIRLPITGWVSILHRISGIALVLSIPFGVYLFSLSVSGPEGFAAAAAVLDSGLVRLLLLVIGWSFLHHLFAGVRFLMLDLQLGIDRPAARKSAWIAITAAVALLVIGGGLLL